MSEAKKYADAEKFAKAKLFYARALKFLRDLGWHKEIETIKNEITLLTEKEYVRDERARIEQELTEQKRARARKVF